MANLWFRTALIESGWADSVRLRIHAGKIAGIEVGARPESDDEQHDIALVGMPNLHSHAFQRAMAGLTETKGPQADSFWTWREVMYRFVERLDPEDVEAIAALAYAEMLESGFTRVGEFHYLHNDRDGAAYTDPGELAQRIAAAAESSGIGLTLLPVLYAHSNFGGRPPNPGQRRFVKDIDGFARLIEASRRAVAPLAGAVVGVAPHSLRAVTAQELTAAVELAAGGPVHIHIAEQTREVDECVAWSGQRPIEWLLDHASVNERWCLVHATHMTAQETQRSAQSGAVAGLCPITEANLGDGVFPALAFVDCGGRYGIGSDSNVLIDVGGELRALEYSQRLTHRGRNLLASAQTRSTGRSLFDAAVRGGAQALAGDRNALPAGAALSVGSPADIVSLDGAHSCLISRREDAILDSWIFAARERAVDCVWRNGRKLVSRGAHVAREGIESRYRRTLARLLS
jgi:formimidoylglutamate deiminase